MRLCARREKHRLARAFSAPAEPKICRQWSTRLPVDLVPAPEIFVLHGKAVHERVVEFLESLRASFATDDRLTVIDLSRTSQLLPGGTLLFYAELYRLRQLFPTKQFKFIRSNDQTVNEVFEHLGMYASAGFNSKVVPKRADVVGWTHVTSAENDGPLAGGLLEAQEALSKFEVKQLFRGVSEAVPNAIEHAYIGPRNDHLPAYDEKRWWMFCRETDSRLFVAVCDLGVGIPESLPRTFGETFVGKLLSGLSLGGYSDDASMIRAAMEIARTRTEKDERGKGLGDIRTVADRIKGCELHIFSNRGTVSYIGGEFDMTRHRRSILGTIVVWIIPIEKVTP